MPRILNEADLQRANIAVAWSFSNRMTPEQFEELCRVTIANWRHQAEQEVTHVG